MARRLPIATGGGGGVRRCDWMIIVGRLWMYIFGFLLVWELRLSKAVSVCTSIFIYSFVCFINFLIILILIITNTIFIIIPILNIGGGGGAVGGWTCTTPGERTGELVNEVTL